jgi:hypothetical protein
LVGELLPPPAAMPVLEHRSPREIIDDLNAE